MTRTHLLACAIAAAVGGCFVVPKTTATAKVVGTTEGPITPDRAMTLAVDAQVSGGLVRMHATRSGQCSREQFDIVEHVAHTSARLGGSDDPRARFFGVLIAPVTLPISAAVTGLIVAGRDDRRTREERSRGRRSFACTIAGAGEKVVLGFPSGATVTRVLDARGDVTIAIPEIEPYAGEVLIHADGFAPRTMRYQTAVPAVMAAREAVAACTHDLPAESPRALRLSIDRDGRVTRFDLGDNAPDVMACLGPRLAASRFAERLRGKVVLVPGP